MLAVGRVLEADAAGGRRWRPPQTFIIRREGHRIALTSQVRPRPAHDLCRDRPKWPLAQRWAAEDGGRRGYRSGTMGSHADAGAAAKQAPSERARNPTPGAPDGVGAEAGRQESGHVAGLLGR